MNMPDCYYQSDRSEMSIVLPLKYSRVLEIGCGHGNFRSNLKEENEYWGVEPIHAAAIQAESKLDRLLEGFYDEVADLLPDNYFDLIVCNDVIEHMADPWSFLKNIKSKMTVDSCLVCSIPNVRYLLNLYEVCVKKDWLYKEYGILDRTHLRFFTRKSFNRVFKECGYVVDSCKGLNGIGDMRKGLVGFAVRTLCFGLQIVLGDDIKYPQFGMRIRAQKG